MVRTIVAVAACLGVLAVAPPARADFALGAGISGNFGLSNAALHLPDAWSVDAQLGYRIKLGPVELTPELDLTYLRSTGTLRMHDVDWAFQVAGGGRVGVEIGFVVPSAYFHYGLGTVQFASQDLVSINKMGPYFEAGGALDFRLAEELSLGVQVGYGSVSLSNLEADLKNANISRVRAGIRLTLFL
ncbi:MAG: outer membrane beta-barrel protein [Myxococcales bacterium]